MESVTDSSRTPSRISGFDFYHLIAGAPPAICAVDGQLRLREASARARTLFGGVRILPGRDLGEVLQGIWTEAFAADVVTLMRDALASGEPQHVREAAARRNDGRALEYYDLHFQRTPLPGGGLGIVAYFLEATERVRAQKLLEEQTRLLGTIAGNRSLEECLEDLTASVARLHAPLRAGVLVSNAQRSQVQVGYSACFPASFSESLRGAPIEQKPFGTCCTAMRLGTPAGCTDVQHDGDWSPEWRKACAAHGIRSLYSTPVATGKAGPAASFFLGLSEPRAPSAWELQIAKFGAEITAIAMQRDRSLAELREQRWSATEDLAAITQLHALSMRMVRTEDFQALLDDILMAATEFTGTGQGNIQFLDPATGKLRMVAHRGFSGHFLAYFAESGWDATCESAATLHRRVIVEDVLELPRGTVSDESLQVVLGEGIRAIQSTPLVSRDGRLLGMLSSHFAAPHRPGERELRLVDLLARQAADLIETRRADAALAGREG